MSEGIDIFTKLNKLSLNYEDIRLLMTIPDLLVISINPVMLTKIKEKLKIDYETARMKQQQLLKFMSIKFALYYNNANELGSFSTSCTKLKSRL